MRKSRSKFGAIPTVIDGLRFASKGEAKRWGELQLLVRSGEITDLRRQVRLPLHAWDERGNRHLVCHYVADFVYADKNGDVIEDFKGFRTPEYKLKARLFEICYGFAITETGTKARKVGAWIQRRDLATRAA